MDEVDASTAVRLLAPRVVAIITTLDGKGVVNAAPYSWVFPFSYNPPMVAVGVGKGGKHTQLNAEKRKEFVVNLISEDFAQRAVKLETRHELGENIVAKIGLHTQPSLKVKTPGIKEAKIRIECKYAKTVDVKKSDHVLVVGNVVAGKCAAVKGGIADLDKLDLLMHVSGTEFRKIGERVGLKRFK